VHPPHPVDRQLMAKLPPAVRVEAVPHGNPLRQVIAWRDHVRSMMGVYRDGYANERAAAGVDGKPASGTGQLGTMKHFLLDWRFLFPDPQCAWLKPAVAFAKKWPQAEIPDVVLATGGPWTSHLVGQHLARYWRVPYIVDYRDPWTSNPYVSFGSSYLNGKARRLEQSVCRAAKRVITNTHELRVQLEHDYPGLGGKILTITNGFDPDSFVTGRTMPGNTGQGPTHQAGKAKLELCHFGTVYGKRTPAVLFQALHDLHQAGRVSSEQLRIRFIGAWEVSEPRCEDLAQRLEKVGLLRREPPVPYQECLQQMCEADALLVVQPDSPLQIPGKIYEYVATQRPLLLVGGEGATANLVQRHRLGLACPNDAGKIRQLMGDVLEGRQVLSASPQAEIDRFNYRSLTADLACVLDEVWKEYWQEHRKSAG
jgi:glycosyltransferase involved in cell wall biosynthesis